MPDAQSNLPSQAAQPPSRELAIDDCWNRIGVQGDSSCGELKTHIHCRNCPAFVAAGLKLLDRNLTRDYREEWTRLLAVSRPRTAAAALSALIFRVGRTWLALSTGLFQEITEARRIHSLPHRRNSVILGLANIRGELLVCMDLHRVLRLEPSGPRSAAPSRSRFMVVNWKDQRFVFPVAEIRGVQRYDESDLRDPPRSPAGNSFVRGVLPLPEGLWAHALEETRLMTELNQSLA